MHLQRNLRLFNELELIFQAERESTRKQMSVWQPLLLARNLERITWLALKRSRIKNHLSGARFSKVPRTFRARKAIRKATTYLFYKGGLLICCKGNKNKNNCKVSCLETPSFWRYKENYVIRNTPEKFRDFRETGPSSRLVYLCWYSTPPASQRSGFQSLLRPECVRCARNCENHTNSFKPPQCINGGAFWGFLPLRKTLSPRAKNYDNFSRVWDGQSAADTPLALLNTMNE